MNNDKLSKRKQSMKKIKNAFDENDMERFKPAEKIGLVASVNPDGLPHISLITSIIAVGPTQLTLGEFCKGKSKEFIRNNPKLGFLIMTFDKKMWSGKAKWTHSKNQGTEFEIYNDQPMFRYNAYYGIHTVHYLDLVETSVGTDLFLPWIIVEGVLTKLAKGGVTHPRNGENQEILTPFALDIFNGLGNLKFISWVNDDGYPTILPVFQCQAADSGRLAFTSTLGDKGLGMIPENTQVAVFAMTMKMESVLVRGRFRGFQKSRGIGIGTINIDWVYNSMPPCHGQIYPPVSLKPVEQF